MNQDDLIKLAIIQKELQENLDKERKGSITIFYEKGKITGYKEQKDMFFASYPQENL